MNRYKGKVEIRQIESIYLVDKKLDNIYLDMGTYQAVINLTALLKKLEGTEIEITIKKIK